MNRRKLTGLIRLFRPELPFSAGVCVLLGELLAVGGIPRVRELLLGFFSYFFISATALILNDFFDVEIDRVNAPHRPLPSGMVEPRDVVILSLVVAFLGIALSALVSLPALALVLMVWVVGLAYNWRFKRAGEFLRGFHLRLWRDRCGAPGRCRRLVVRCDGVPRRPR
jgi:geranylgeranylglycerol-phosphate geranylgeranyltransferase